MTRCEKTCWLCICLPVNQGNGGNALIAFSVPSFQDAIHEH